MVMEEEQRKSIVRADMVEDLKRIDEQLQRHLNNVWRNQKNDEPRVRITAKEEWEIEPGKLVVTGAVIGKGTFGSVHKGVYDGRDVAVKLVDWGREGQCTKDKIASLRKAFAQEVSVWNKLDHPNVTKLIGATRDTTE